ncbi:MAG: peptidoglycan DD-metalloendopeptidase family protein [Lentisphaerales bacterium]|nr:peptidoglycan DD-metalloendopeptidase family protein [Lentisphaerales bacterium]
MYKIFFLGLFLFTALQGQSDSKQFDIVLSHLGSQDTREKAIIFLKKNGRKYEERILHHIHNKTKFFIMAVDACKFVESEKILTITQKLLKHENKHVRLMALSTLWSRLPAEKLGYACDHMLQDVPVSGGESLFEYLNYEKPSEERILRLLKNKEYWGVAGKYLCGCRGEKANKSARNLLVRGKGVVIIHAINAMIAQYDTDPRVKKLVHKHLTNANSTVRERAAEYFRWYGDAGDLEKLSLALNEERDFYTKSTIRAAIQAIKNRDEVFPQKKLGVGFKEGMSLFELKSFLSKNNSAEMRAKVIKSLYSKPIVEPHYLYGKGIADSDKKLLQEQVHLQRLLAGYGSLENQGMIVGIKLLEGIGVNSLVPPTPDYLAKERKNYGKYIEPGNGPFSESVHVGDDCNFTESYTPIYAIADGVVRYVDHLESWGGLVIIEHKFKTGEYFCSLYGHLGALMIPKPGDLIKAGDKIGSLGRNYRWENGGYSAHLHFGIHKSRFTNYWIKGYLSKEDFDSKSHKWVSPQKFIQKHLSPHFD